MDAYQLGITGRRQSLTIGTQYTLFEKAKKRNNAESQEDAGQESAPGEAPTPSKKQRTEDSAADGPAVDEGGKQEHPKEQTAAGGKTPAADPQGDDRPDSKRDEEGAVRAEREHPETKQEDQKAGDASPVRDEGGATGAESGSHETDRKLGTEGGDGHPPAADAKQEQSDSG
jgi:hypothetical protein